MITFVSYSLFLLPLSASKSFVTGWLTKSKWHAAIKIQTWSDSLLLAKVKEEPLLLRQNIA